MTNDDPIRHLSRRERQAMDVLYRLGRASATEIHGELPDPPSYSSVRSMLRLLEEKSLVRHESDGTRYVFEPTVPREKAGTSALQHLVSTFFGGSTEEAVATLLSLGRAPEEGRDQEAVATLLSLGEQQLDEESIARLRQRIEKAREEGR